MSGLAPPHQLASRIADAVGALAAGDGRRLIAVAGPPGAGKTTVASHLRKELSARGAPAGLVAMDGFHYDNTILKERGLLDRKGAPETFDVAGFRSLLARLLVEAEVAVPEFDRASDQSIAARALVRPEHRTVVVEGNYLLLDEPGWRDLRQYWAFSVLLDLSLDDIEDRLLARWRDHGLQSDLARARVMQNDLPNADRVIRNSAEPDLALR